MITMLSKTIRCNMSKALLLMLFCLFGVTVSADAFERAGVYYTYLSDGFVEVAASSSGTYSGDIVIPFSFYENGELYAVRGIGNNAFQGASGLTSVKLPMYMTFKYIGEYAFNDCSLTSFMIPSQVTKIGKKAFYFCDKMKDLYVCATDPATIEEIGVEAFSNINRNGNVCTLHVPVGSKALYVADTRFSKEFDVIEEFTSPVGYDLLVLSTHVTSENQADILGNGAASYDPDNNTLTLYKDMENGLRRLPLINYNNTSSEQGKLIVCAENAVTLHSVYVPVISSNGVDITVAGPAKMKMQAGNGPAVYLEGTGDELIFDHASIEFEGEEGIRGKGGNLTIISSTVAGQVKSTKSTFRGWGNVILTACQIVKPVGGTYDVDSKELRDSEGYPISLVNIKPCVYDLDGNGKVDAADVVILVNKIMEK